MTTWAACVSHSHRSHLAADAGGASATQSTASTWTAGTIRSNRRIVAGFVDFRIEVRALRYQLRAASRPSSSRPSSNLSRPGTSRFSTHLSRRSGTEASSGERLENSLTIDTQRG